MTHALRDLRKAIALDPASGSAHEWYGIALLHEGRVDAAYAELATAAQLDPLSVATTAWLGTASYLERRYGDAIAYARETLDLSPTGARSTKPSGLPMRPWGTAQEQSRPSIASRTRARNAGPKRRRCWPRSTRGGIRWAARAPS